MNRAIRRSLACTLVILAASSAAGTVSTAPAASSPKAATPDVTQILANMEYLRGFRDSGFNFTADVISVDNGNTSEENQLDVKISGAGEALIEVLTPKNQRGRRTLLRGHDIWLYLPSSSNIIRIAPLQRVFGFAAIADVLNVSYLSGYAVETSHVTDSGLLQLTLKSKDDQATYSRIDLDYDVANDRPVETRHYTASGRLLKTIQYKEFRTYDGSPKIEKIAIFDALRTSSVIWMKMGEYRKASYPEALFTKNALSDNYDGQ
jgi:outer membrane lipoprotein-sorting protein